MNFDPDHPSNRGVLEYFGRNHSAQPPSFEPVADPLALRHRSSGSHPDIVEHLWDLAAALPLESRALVYGRAVLVAPTRGVIFAAALGTEYGLRLPPDEFALARSAGAEVIHNYRTVDVLLDLAERFGPHWLFGNFDRREPEWIRSALEFADR
ncbi:MAG TPA: hypothetical protein VFH26_09775 [Gemmatimonadales bacterium]|nr:hypothetical protein [Gemmatimonadales bacterium]